MGEETSTQLLLRNESLVGQTGSDGTSSVEEERAGEVKEPGKYRRGALLVGVTLRVAATFLRSRICLRAGPHLPMLHGMKLQAARSLARKGRFWPDCPNTFRKDFLIKALQRGSIFRHTS